MRQDEKAKHFSRLHVKGNPVLLFNAWDAGSAKSIAAAGAKAVATSSSAVADAQGYKDGENLPVELLETIVSRIVAVVDVPVTVDFEGGYTEDDSELARKVSRLLALGIVGINFEDRVVKGTGLYDVDRQARRISFIRAAADKAGVPLFINARTDLFFGRSGPGKPIDDALVRAKAYADAGASGLFVPGLGDESLLSQLCERSPLPINVMAMDGIPPRERLAEIGVARVSYGPFPYFAVMKVLEQNALKALK